ncbi:hypothetical protein LAZ67_13003127 [Cordylochernes scorpioides]|uniref:Gamma-glutamyltranspeptidase n=1 Tax=Cordylochernes scorpioides TaxID=51811 RepID=A0ABY6L916_9ARAC|nr:hypothetical protein LAZ67_13003127 [Cordylochernes scorpioides]
MDWCPVTSRRPLPQDWKIQSGALCDVTEILERGGNAADSAVAMAAALNVTEPMSTGLGGDCYCLFYRASDGAVLGINGSGRTPAALTRSRIPPEGLPPTHGLTVTVPGAAAGWVDTIEKFGSQQLALSEILAPAVRLAKNGYKVTPLVSRLWSKNCQGLPAGTDLLPESSKPPVEGERVTMPNLARTLTELGEHGKDGFFKGRVAEAIVAAVKEAGGCLGLVDLAATADDPHFTDMEPVSAKFDGLTVWESSANSQGVVALLALRLLEHHLPRLSGLEHNSPEYVAILTRCFHLAFQQGLSHVTSDTSTHSLLALLQADSVEHLLHQAITPLPAIPTSSDTTYITALDAQGNACSFINSIFTPFGSKIVPRDCGFALHNRGLFFSLDPRWSPNTYSPRSRPYHTLTPGLVTQGDGQLVASLGTMGGFMQPQAHVQVGPSGLYQGWVICK